MYTPIRHKPTLDDFKTAITGGDVIRHQDCGGRVVFDSTCIIGTSPTIYAPRWACACGRVWTPERVEKMKQDELEAVFFRARQTT